MGKALTHTHTHTEGGENYMARRKIKTKLGIHTITVCVYLHNAKGKQRRPGKYTGSPKVCYTNVYYTVQRTCEVGGTGRWAWQQDKNTGLCCFFSLLSRILLTFQGERPNARSEMHQGSAAF